MMQETPQQAAAAAPVVLPGPAVVPPKVTAEDKDIFNKFAAEVAARGQTLEQVFKQYDKDGNGNLDKDEMVQMMKDYVPAASKLDVDHFRAILDVDGNNKVGQ